MLSFFDELNYLAIKKQEISSSNIDTIYGILLK